MNWRKGIAKLADSAKRGILQQWVRRELADRLQGRPLVIDSRIAAHWGMLVRVSEAHRRQLPVLDGLIEATTLQHDLTIVTRNMDDLERCGASCVNLWTEK